MTDHNATDNPDHNPTGCRCTMLTAATLQQPAEWEQADDCPAHPLVEPDGIMDPTWYDGLKL